MNSEKRVKRSEERVFATERRGGSDDLVKAMICRAPRSAASEELSLLTPLHSLLVTGTGAPP